MHRAFFLAAAVVSIFLVLTDPALAQSNSQSFGIGAFGGYSFATCNGAPISTGTHYDAQTTCDNGPTVGMWLGGQFNRYFGIEGAMATPWNKHAVTVRYWGNTYYGEESDPLIHMYVMPTAYLAKGWIVPYISPGIGYTKYLYEGGALLNVGGGLRIFAGKSVLFRLDIRRNWSKGIKSATNHVASDDIASTESTFGIAYVIR
jgi:hypothetical protein